MSRNLTVTSSDEEWIDDLTHWHFAERNDVFDMIHQISIASLDFPQSFYLEILGSNDDGTMPATIRLTAGTVHPKKLQAIANAICRLVRPSRYHVGDHDPASDRPVIYTQVFIPRHATSHEKIEALTRISDIAMSMGRTSEGIEAAFAELNDWQSSPFPSSLERRAS